MLSPDISRDAGGGAAGVASALLVEASSVLRYGIVCTCCVASAGGGRGFNRIGSMLWKVSPLVNGGVVVGLCVCKSRWRLVTVSCGIGVSGKNGIIVLLVVDRGVAVAPGDAAAGWLLWFGISTVAV